MKSESILRHALIVIGLSLLTACPYSAFGDDTTKNQALWLDGHNDFLQVKDSPAIHTITDALTIELWFKADELYQRRGMVNSLVRKNLNPGKEIFLIRLRSQGNGKNQIEFTPGLNIGMVAFPYQFELEKWYHLAGTYDGTHLNIYLNGVRVKKLAGRGQISLDNSDLVIGRGDPTWSEGEFFHGEMDEIRIWNTARTEDEIRATLNVSLTEPTDALVAYWNFDDGQPTDLSSNKHNSTLQGDTTIIKSERQAITIDTSMTNQISEEQLRMETLDALWTNLNNIYPALEYKGVFGPEWIAEAKEKTKHVKNDAEFYDILLQLMASLNDTHTGIGYYPEQYQKTRPAVELNQIQGQIAVIRAHPDTGLNPGDVILTIDDTPVNECLTDTMRFVNSSTTRARIRGACSRLLTGLPNTEVKLTIRDQDNKEKHLSVSRDGNRSFFREPLISSRKISDDIGYIRITQWGGDTLVPEFDRMLEEFKDTKGLIIDVRGNGGGSGTLADMVNGRLLTKPVVSSIDFWRQAGTDTFKKTIGWVKPRGDWQYKGRVAALIDEGCASSCEHFISGLEAMGTVLLVGTPTNGAGGGPTSVTLPDGTIVRISQAYGVRANGITFEGHGIPPHIEINPTLDDIRKGEDLHIKAATEWIISDKDVPQRMQHLIE